MAKANFKSQTGAIITIEGNDKEVARILAYLETTTTVEHAKQAIKRASSEKKNQKKRESASDLIIELKEEGFFDKPKTLSEVAKALEQKAHLYSITSLSGVMITLVQRRFLRRKKVNGKWVYGK